MSLKIKELGYLIVILCVLDNIESHRQSNFIIDYFVFKNVPYVVGFSCWNVKEKLTLSRGLSKFGIRTSYPRLDVDSQMFQLIGSRYTKIGVFLNISCFEENKVHSLLSKAADWRLYDEMHSWMIFAKGNLSKSAFGMSTDLLMAMPMTNGYELFDVYNAWKEGGAKINVTPFGNWNRSTGLHVTMTQSKFRRRCNLHKLAMKSSFFANTYRPKSMPLEEYLQDYSTGSKDGLSKFGYIVLTHLSEMYNFTFEFGEVDKWLPDDFLGPMSRALLDNEIQFAGSSVVLTHERIRLTKFVYPVWPFRTCFIFRNPQPRGIKIGSILRPFRHNSWYALATMTLGISFILAVCLGRECYSTSQNNISNAFLMTLGSMSQQSTSFDLQRSSSRMLFINLMTFGFISYNFYSAIVVSMRLHEPIFKVNDSLNELGKLQLKMASEPMMYFDIIFNLLTAWERRVFYEDRWLNIAESKRFMYPEKAMSLVREGGFAYHAHPDVSYPIIETTFTARQICELAEVNPLAPAYSALSVTYNSTFFELAKIGLSRMTEVGIRKRQLGRWNSRKPVCDPNVMNVSSTDIYEFAPHLIALLIGMIVATLIFLCEFRAVKGVLFDVPT